MKLEGNRLVGENALENRVLRAFIERVLNWVGPQEPQVGDPGETGIMSIKAEADDGSLDCEAWIEAEPHYWGAGPGDLERGDFDIAFRWRTPEREGDWFEIDDAVQWAE